MSVIVQTALGLYGAHVVAAFIRLLALIALVIMPLGMAATPALAQPGHHSMAANHAMPAGHCGEEQAPAPSKMDCTAACTALPASWTPMPEPALKPKAPRALSIAAPFSGIEPEIATPPPRFA